MSDDISKRCQFFGWIVLLKTQHLGIIKVLPPATAASAFPGSAYPGK